MSSANRSPEKRPQDLSKEKRPDPWSIPSRWLEAVRAQGLERHHRRLALGKAPSTCRIDGHSLRLFASNDYLGLTRHPALIAAWQAGATRWGVGAGASALICGYTDAHAALEEELAHWLGFPAARLFTSGYAANLAAVTAFLHDGAVAFFADKLVHASLIDALQLARAAGARVRRYPHGDLATLRRWMQENQEPLKVIVTDAVFSMDGDLAPLAELAAIARYHRAWLIVDDAHGIGIWGKEGRGTYAYLGLTPEPNWVWVVTFGKALGVAGAAILGSVDLIAWLDQTARTHRYTTAMPPAQAETLHQAVHLVREAEPLRTHLAALIAHWQRCWAELICRRSLPLHLMPSQTPIQPLLIGDSQQTVVLAQRLEALGFLVPAIRPPTVPPQTARLRISLSAAHTFTDLDELIVALALAANG